MNEVKSKRDSDSKEEITLDEKTYCLTNNTITYSLSKYARAHSESLVNRGANTGVAKGKTE